MENNLEKNIYIYIYLETLCPESCLVPFPYVCVCVCVQTVVQLQSLVQLFVTPWTAACQASLLLTISWSLLKFM